MHDFRPTKKVKSEFDNMLSHSMLSESKRLLRSQNPERNQNLYQSASQLDPILETEDAQAIHLKHLYLPKAQNKTVTSRRTMGSKQSVMTEMSDPDNGIFFLDNNIILKDPQNQKTPPPPMWGEILEEDLYDENTPFYDEDLVLKEQEARLKKI